MTTLLLTLAWYASLPLAALFTVLYLGGILLGLDYPFVQGSGVFGACFAVYAGGAAIFDPDLRQPWTIWSRVWTFSRERAEKKKVSLHVLHDDQETHYSAVPVGQGFYLVRMDQDEAEAQQGQK